MNIFFILFSAFLYTLSFPKFSIWWFSFFSLIPFFFVLEKESSSIKTGLYGFFWGAFITAGMGYWVFFALLHHYGIYLPKAILFFFLCLMLPMGLIYICFALIYRFLHRNHAVFYALILPSIWVFIEYLKELIPFMIPWGGIGYTMIDFYDFVQSADIFGIYGITFIVVMINALSWFAIQRWYLKKDSSFLKSSHRIINTLFPLCFVLIVLSIPVAYGKFKTATLNSGIDRCYQKTESIQAILVQGNFSLEQRWSGMGFYHRIKTYLEMTGEGEGSRERVIVWPETTLNSSTYLNDELFMQIINYIGENSLLVSGGLKESDTGDVYNCAYIISGQGRLSRYDKHILLPYAETSPLIDLLDRYYAAPSEFKSGRTPLSVLTSHGHIGTSICFEILYPRHIRQSIEDGATFLVNISNDAWFGDSPMPYNHLNAARFRAIENRRFLLRASNSGISAIIRPDGMISKKSGLFTKEQVAGDFIRMSQRSFYSKFGDWALYGSVMLLLAAMGYIFIKE